MKNCVLVNKNKKTIYLLHKDNLPSHNYEVNKRLCFEWSKVQTWHAVALLIFHVGHRLCAMLTRQQAKMLAGMRTLYVGFCGVRSLFTGASFVNPCFAEKKCSPHHCLKPKQRCDISCLWLYTVSLSIRHIVWHRYSWIYLIGPVRIRLSMAW